MSVRSREELRDFTEQAVCPIHWVDADGRIQWANQAELDLLGYPREEYVGRSIADFHVDQDVAADLMARLSRHETIREVEARLRCKDGMVRHVLIDGNVLARDGELVDTCCFTRDISALRLASRERELFLGMLGHDLRNPLGAIVASASSLALHGGLDERARRMVTRIGNSSSRMARLVEQILDFSSARAGGGIPVVRQPVDIAAICDEVIDELRTAHPDRQIEARCLGDGSGVWDPDRLSQVFSNLVGNALAHGDPHEPIRVLVTQQNGQVMVRVHNMGPPIPADTIPTLFDPFRRALDRKRTAVPGLGLGLFITREIVQAHGGTIEVRSSREGGTTFCVRLPRHDGVAVRVLVVDDDGDLAEMVRDTLQRLGHNVLVANDGPDALTAAERFDPHVVLLDVGLPCMDGFEVARRLRERGTRARLVAMTGRRQQATDDVRFDAYLIKPVDVATLQRTVGQTAA